MKKTTNGKATGKAKRTNAERVKARREAEHNRAYREAKLTAAAFVAAIRVKVLELTRQAGILDNILGHPDKKVDGLMLRCCLDDGGMGRFIRAAYRLEEMLDGMLAGDAEPSVPDLAAALRRAGETYISFAAVAVQTD